MNAHHYIIVGGGSAGATLAARLSDDPRARVTLLEAGSDERTSQAPPELRSLDYSTAMYVPGRMWLDLEAKRTPVQTFRLYERGRGLGGSSAINGMLAFRARPEDFDRWAAEYGCTGWSWDEILPSFLAIEDDVDFGGDGLHGAGGPLPVYRQPPEHWLPLDHAVAAAWAGFGWGYTDSYHRLDSTGWGPSAWSVRDGHRVSSNDAFLDPVRDRENLTVRGNVLVDTLLLDGTRARGVRTVGGEEITADEVILCSGSIHTPGILLRSGIGPESGRPVGRNLQEHPGGAVLLTLVEGAGLPSSEHLVSAGHGHYASGLAEGGRNDMQLFHGTFGTFDDGRPMAVMGASVMRAFSQGTVTLASHDPAVHPVVEFDWLSDRRDLDRLRDGMRRLQRLIEFPAIAELTTEVTAGSQPFSTLRTDDEIDAWLFANARGSGHAVGTCRMGRPDDPDAVVDPQCRVIGYSDLRVIDASIMPDVPKANTNLSTVAIADKASRMLRAELAAGA